jgi:hypothetical protein
MKPTLYALVQRGKTWQRYVILKNTSLSDVYVIERIKLGTYGRNVTKPQPQRLWGSVSDTLAEAQQRLMNYKNPGSQIFWEEPEARNA